ncbi:MAG: hypothetical protein ABIP56_08145, partial [Dokdonella sp.]
LLVHDNDLIVATQGRAIWVLDDLSPLRQMSKATAQSGAYLFTPGDAFRVRRSENRDTPLPPETPLGTNPPNGAIIDYVLPTDASTPVIIEIHDSKGELVRRFASDHKPPFRNAFRYFGTDWTREQVMPGSSAGAHRFVWDLHYQRPRVIGYNYSIAAIHDEDALLKPLGPQAVPGVYDVSLIVGGKTLHAPLRVRMDPRVDAPADGVAQATAFAREIGTALDRAYQGYGELQSVRTQLENLAKAQGVSHSSGTGPMIDALLKSTASLAKDDGHDSHAIPDVSEVLTSLASDVESTDRIPTAPQRAVYADYGPRLTTSLNQWNAIRDGDLAELNAKLTAAGQTAIHVPTLDEIHFEGPGVFRDVP